MAIAYSYIMFVYDYVDIYVCDYVFADISM